MGRRRKKKGFSRFLAVPRMPEMDLDPETKKSIFIVVLLALGAISVLGIFNLAGGLGSSLNDFFTWAFGQTRLLYASLLLAWAFYLYSDRYELRGGNWLGLFLFTMSLQAILSLFVPMDQWETALTSGSGGGQVGMFLAGVFINLMGVIASILITLSLLIISFLLLFNTTLNRMFGSESLIGKILYPVNWLINKIFNRHKEDEEENEDGNEEEEQEEEEEENEEEEEGEDEGEEGEEDEEHEEEEGEEENEEEEHEEEKEEEEDEVELPDFMKKAAVEEDNDPWWMEKYNDEIKIPLNLLNDKKEKPTSGDIEENKEIIQNTLEQFKISVDMGAVCVGPTVTQYTFKPARGVKLSKVTTLSNDLALALAAHPIRIEAPIPGKSLVGIEVPNKTKAMVSLKEILSSKPYKERKHNMMVALGKDVAGQNWLDDVTRMPHLLVAGQTNSGKSVCLNTIIVSLLYQNTADDLRFIMVDPKRVELPGYNGLPHLLCPVITDVKQTVSALNWCLREMESRFVFLSREGFRNIQSYNEANPDVKMPYIVFIIDELADLMVTASKEIETAVIRLAQMSRAVGIHLILATQRPSVNVITGLIKANMPARIAFAVTSGLDSRTILDTMGAEKLLGQGDMLVVNAQISKPLRLQGAYLSDAEIKKVVKYIKVKSSKPNFIAGILEQASSGSGGSMMGGDGGNGGDDKFEEAKEIVVNAGKASASLLQRRMSIGYSRAARLIDLLEENGIVGPANGAKPREIMISKEQYESMNSTGTSGASLHRRDEARAPKSFLGEEVDEEIGGAPVFKSSKVDEDEEDPSTSSGQGDDEEDNDEEENDEEDNDEEENDEEDGEAEDEESEDEESEDENEDNEGGDEEGEDEDEDEDEDDKESDDLEEDNGKYFSK